MKLNKENFLKTEVGSELKNCIIAWDIALESRKKYSLYSDEYMREQRIADQCGIQWSISSQRNSFRNNDTFTHT